MVEPLSVDTDGVHSLGDIHTSVAAGLRSLADEAPDLAAVAKSHGTIASGVTTALTAALDSRSQSLHAAGDNGETLAGLLHQAALAYERGDQGGAGAIVAAAEALASGERPVVN